MSAYELLQIACYMLHIAEAVMHLITVSTCRSQSDRIFPVLPMAYDIAAQPGACEHARAVTLLNMFECISAHKTGDTLSSVVS